MWNGWVSRLDSPIHHHCKACMLILFFAGHFSLPLQPFITASIHAFAATGLRRLTFDNLRPVVTRYLHGNTAWLGCCMAGLVTVVLPQIVPMIIRTFEKPDQDKVFAYVYGHLKNGTCA